MNDLRTSMSHSGVSNKTNFSQDPFWFVKREKFSDDIVVTLLDFLIEFFKEVLGEKSDDSFDDYSKSNTSRGYRSS